MKYLLKICFLLTVLLLLVSSCGKDGKEEDTLSESSSLAAEALSEALAQNEPLDCAWDNTLSSAKGSGTSPEDKETSWYPYSEEYCNARNYQDTVDGVEITLEGIRLRGLVDSEVQSTINNALAELDASIKADTAWMTSDMRELVASSFPEGAEVTPIVNAEVSGSVFADVFSVCYNVTHYCRIIDEDGELLEERSYAELCYMYNWNLNDGREEKLSEIFTSDTDYIALLLAEIKSSSENEKVTYLREPSGLPENFAYYSFSGDSLLLYFPEGNPYDKEGESILFTVPLGNLVEAMALNPAAPETLFGETITFTRRCFPVSGIEYTEITFQAPSKKEESEEEKEDISYSLPAVRGIPAEKSINRSLSEWYSDLISGEQLPGEHSCWEDGFKLKAQNDSAVRYINITLFITSNHTGETITCSRVYDAYTGEEMTVGDFLTEEAAKSYDEAIRKCSNFRLGDDFLLGIPVQDGIESYVVTLPGEVREEVFSR